MNLEAYIQHSALKPDTLSNDVELLCTEAIERHFPAVCVPPLFVKQAKERVKSTPIQVATVVGFPYGYAPVEAKLAEIVLAIVDGADSLEVVVNTMAAKNNDWQYLANEINHIIPIVRAKGKSVTVMLETGLLSEKEIITACDIYSVAAVDFVGIGTGTLTNPLLLSHLKLVRRHLADSVKIKLRAVTIDQHLAEQLIDAGANLVCSNSGMRLW